MSIIDVIESWSGKLASGDGVARTATRMFTVATTAATDTPVTIQQAYHLGVPRKGDLYPGDGLLRCEAPVDVRAIGPRLYQVTATYKTLTSGSQGGDQTNPLAQPATAAWSFSSSDEAIDEDIHGNPLTNVNGEPFDPPITRRQNDPVLTIERNEAVFDYRRAIQYMAKGGATNSGSFFGASKGQARIENISSSGRRFENGIGYDPVTYEIQFRQDGWKTRVLNQGFLVKLPGIDREGVGVRAPSGHLLVLARDAKGAAVTEPILLDRDGYQLDSGSAVWLEYEIHPSMNFGVLNLQ